MSVLDDWLWNVVVVGNVGDLVNVLAVKGVRNIVARDTTSDGSHACSRALGTCLLPHCCNQLLQSGRGHVQCNSTLARKETKTPAHWTEMPRSIRAPSSSQHLHLRHSMSFLCLLRSNHVSTMALPSAGTALNKLSMSSCSLQRTSPQNDICVHCVLPTVWHVSHSARPYMPAHHTDPPCSGHSPVACRSRHSPIPGASEGVGKRRQLLA